MDFQPNYNYFKVTKGSKVTYRKGVDKTGCSPVTADELRYKFYDNNPNVLVEEVTQKQYNKAKKIF